MKIIDLHCDTILRCCMWTKAFRDYQGHVNLDKLQKGGCLAQCFALFIPTHDACRFYFGENREPWELYCALLKCYKENLMACADAIRPALTAEDIWNNSESGFISSILTVEDIEEIDGQMERLDELYRDGVRMIALTWNYENCVGFPNSADHEEHTRKGLKPFGFQVLERMNELGMVVDVSHLSEAGFYDVAQHSKKPFAASHSCCRALKDHPRNLTDDQLRALGDSGGVIGINFCDVFLGSKNGFSAIEDIVRHLVYAKNKAGIESVALGSDMDGIESTLEFSDYSGYPHLLKAMEKQFTADEIDKICSGNFLRVFSAQNG